MDTIIQPVAARTKRGSYRRHSDEFKRASVARTQINGASVSLIARELKINTNQLFSWRTGASIAESTLYELIIADHICTTVFRHSSSLTEVMMCSPHTMRKSQDSLFLSDSG